jgi:pimeloyl-ACP methyl ester carboxylesterase
LGDFPDHFKTAGYAVLAYDHRNFGSSDGVLRQEANLVQQSDDLFDVISYASTLAPAIDPSKIITWGPGHGAGIGMPIAAVDNRVKAAIFALPFISGLVDSEKFPKGAYERAVQERIDRVIKRDSKKDPIYHPIFADSVEEAKENPWSTVIGAHQAVPFHAGAKSLSDAAGTPVSHPAHIQTIT